VAGAGVGQQVAAGWRRRTVGDDSTVM